MSASASTAWFAPSICVRGGGAFLEWAGRFARKIGAELEVVHVLAHTLVQLGGVHSGAARAKPAAEVSGEQICRIPQNTDTAGEIGEPPAAGHEVAASRTADLWVMGCGRDSGLAGRLRANADTILREAPCPVVTV